MKFQRLALTLCALATLQGCVSASRHKEEVDALQTQLANERSAKEQAEAKIQQDQETIKGQDQKLLAVTKDKGQLQTSLNDMQKAMDEMKARQAEERKRLQEYADLTRRFKKLTDSGTLSVKIVDGKMVVSLGSDLLFPAGSAHLSKEGLKAIKEVAAQLATIKDRRYQVEGHTDNQRIATATFPSNWELASARALTVVKTMIDAGLGADRVSAASYADTQPVQTNDTPEGRAANRRVAIVVVPDLSSLPGYEELKKFEQ
jgi:chemotaxis protein MotB